MGKLDAIISVVYDFFTKGTFDFKEFIAAVLSIFGISTADIDKMIPSLDGIMKGIQDSIRMLEKLLIVACIFIALYYIFNSLVWYKCAKQHGVKHAWLAWIPVVRVYVMGESATAYSPMKLFGKKQLNHIWIIILALPVCADVVAMAFGLFQDVKVIGALFMAIGSLCSLILSLAIIVFNFCVLYRLFAMYKGDKTATIMALFSLLGITVPFFVLSILKKERVNDGIDFSFGDINVPLISKDEKNVAKKQATKKTNTATKKSSKKATINKKTTTSKKSTSSNKTAK